MTPTSTSTCPTCGGAVLPGDRFCGSCGSPVAVSASAPASSNQVPPALDTVDLPVGDTSPWGAVAARLQSATLGEFEILTELGRGGMAAVYLARDLALNRRVAIKVMAPGLMLGQGMVERFRQEAITVANLQHAHIVSIYAVRALDDLHFFVMQFVPGRTLEGVLREGSPLPIPVIRAWLYQMGAALGYAHRRGVIHRDVKPGNILLNADGEAIVTDFGIAKVAETPSHTQTGTVVGTPVYMSPEQCFAKELTGASDQYSLGIVAYEMLAGRPPFSGSSFALMRAHTDDPPPSLRAVRPDVPPSMEAAVERMLAKKPQDRFGTLAEALVSLGAGPVSPDDPLHLTLQQLAAASERLEQLGGLIRTPASPIPKTRERPKPPAPITPQTPVPSTPSLVVAMEPPPSDLEPGATTTLRAAVKDATRGEPVPSAEVHWTSSAVAVVEVDAGTGLLRAVAPGSAVITATIGVARDAVDVVVAEPKPARIEISIPPGAWHVGDDVVVTAVVTSRFGIRVARPIEWSVEDASVVVIGRSASSAVGASVILHGRAGGTTGIVATCGGAVARVSVRVVPAIVTETPIAPTAGENQARSRPPAPSATVVLPPMPVAIPASTPIAPEPPSRLSLPPEARREKLVHTPVDTRANKAAVSAGDVAGNAEPSRAGTWRWVAAAVAVVGAIGYLASRPSTSTPLKADSAVTQAPDSLTAPSIDTTARVATNPPASGASTSATSPESTTTPAATESSSVRTPVAPTPRRIDVRPSIPKPITPGQTLTLAASVRGAAGEPMPRARVTWSSSDSRIAVVDPTRGIVRGVSAGAARITAHVGDVVSTITVAVSAPAVDATAVAGVDVSDMPPMTVGETTRLTATVRNALGATVSGTDIQWSSSNADIAAVAPNGLVTARAPGVATIRASAGGRTGDRAVTVRAKEVVVRPDTPSTPPPNPSAPAPAKSEAELRAEVQTVLTTFVRAIEAKDTTLIRRVFPTASSVVMTRWQTTFNDARGPIRLTGDAAQITDTPRDAAGAQVHARANYSARFSSRSGRADVTFPVPIIAVLQRDGGTWRIVSMQ